MILACPFCGFDFNNGLRDGVASCNHCGRIFDSNLTNLILSACWLLRKNKYANIEQLKNDMKISEEDTLLIDSLTELNHDELLKYLKKLKSEL